MNDSIEVTENATEPWEEFKCDNCGAVIRVNPFGTWKPCEYIRNGYKHVNAFVDCPKCCCTVLRYPSK